MLVRTRKCLNPCFSGCWSRTVRVRVLLVRRARVLILVLVDVGLGLVVFSALMMFIGVLILVLVDVGLGQPWLLDGGEAGGLNPCFSGCWSRTCMIESLRLI